MPFLPGWFHRTPSAQQQLCGYPAVMLRLASTSATRKALLTGAGLVFESSPAPIDERAEEARALGKAPEAVARQLAEAEERRFWETHDSSDYVDWSKAERVRLPNLKPSCSPLAGWVIAYGCFSSS